jgi:hypothetical protein
MLEAVSSFQTRLKDWISHQLTRRVVWICDERSDLAGNKKTDSALVAILGRRWYRERRKSYPVRGVTELRKILRLELAGKPETLFHIGPLRDDKRHVTFFELTAGLTLASTRAAFVVPESQVVGLSLSAGEIAVVRSSSDTDYFVTADGISQLRGGALQNAELFCMAIGIAPPESVIELSGEGVRSRLQAALTKIDLGHWFDALNPAFVGSVWRLAQPLGATLSALLLTYLLLVSGYLAGATAFRNHQIEQLGPEVNGLLEKQRRLESLAADYQGLADLTDDSMATYKIWGVITTVWQSGGSVSAISVADGAGSLRGNAPVATDVLSKLGSESAIRSPSFDAPVRQSGESEEFVIKFNLADSAKSQ